MPLNRFIIPFNGVCGKKSRTQLLEHGSTVKSKQTVFNRRKNNILCHFERRKEINVFEKNKN